MVRELILLRMYNHYNRRRPLGYPPMPRSRLAVDGLKMSYVSRCDNPIVEGIRAKFRFPVAKVSETGSLYGKVAIGLYVRRYGHYSSWVAAMLARSIPTKFATISIRRRGSINIPHVTQSNLPTRPPPSTRSKFPANSTCVLPKNEGFLRWMGSPLPQPPFLEIDSYVIDIAPPSGFHPP